MVRLPGLDSAETGVISVVWTCSWQLVFCQHHPRSRAGRRLRRLRSPEGAPNLPGVAPKKHARKSSRPEKHRWPAGVRCKNLYRFIRLRLTDAPSDREIARRWAMEWKSFVALKHGKRGMPRVEELEALARHLEVDPAFVFQAARGVPADEVAALLAREHRWRALLERVTDAVFTVDGSGRLQDVSSRFCALVGRSAQALAQQPLIDLVSPRSAPRLLATLAEVAREGAARGAEVELEGAQGGVRIVELDASRILDAAGAPIGAQLAARDVTDERRLVRELDAQRRLLQTLYHCVPAACILFDRDGTILSANPLVESVCPLTASEITGRNAYDVFGNPGPTGCPVTRAFLTGHTEQQVSRVQNRAGQTVYVHRTAGPIVQDGKVEQVIEMMVDVTRQIESGDIRVIALCRSQPDDAEAPHSDRRAVPRAATSFVASYAHRGRAATATVTSLGPGGLFLQLRQEDAAVEVGEAVEVEWSLPGDAVPVRARGVVVWSRAKSDRELGGFGVRFVDAAPLFAPVTAGRRQESSGA